MTFHLLDASADARFASRKWRLALLAFAMVWAGFFVLAVVRQFLPDFYSISPEQALDFTVWVVGLYMAGNVGDTVAEGLRS